MNIFKSLNLIILSTILIAGCSSNQKKDTNTNNINQTSRFNQLKDENKQLRKKIKLSQDISKLELNNKILQLESSCQNGQFDKCDEAALLHYENKKFLKAVKLWKFGCDHGYDNACYNMGVSYQNKNSYREAQKLFLISCNRNHPISCNNLAFVEFKLKNKNNARMYFKKSCELKLKEGCNNMAKLEYGEKNKKSALKFFQKSCFLGEIEVCPNVIALDNEIKQEALKKYTQRCFEKSPIDCYNKGYVQLLIGERKKAASAFTEACDMGDMLSCGYMGVLKQQTTIIENIRKEFDPKCSEGDNESCFYLSCLFSLNKDAAKSINYFKEALQNGYKDWDHIDESIELEFIKNNPEYNRLQAKFRN